ncbi:DH domain-containing protein [Balamuthia mandrillaris]
MGRFKSENSKKKGSRTSKTKENEGAKTASAREKKAEGEPAKRGDVAKGSSVKNVHSQKAQPQQQAPATAWVSGALLGMGVAAFSVLFSAAAASRSSLNTHSDKIANDSQKAKGSTVEHHNRTKSATEPPKLDEERSASSQAFSLYSSGAVPLLRVTNSEGGGSNHGVHAASSEEADEVFYQRRRTNTARKSASLNALLLDDARLRPSDTRGGANCLEPLRKSRLLRHNSQGSIENNSSEGKEESEEEHEEEGEDGEQMVRSQEVKVRRRKKTERQEIKEKRNALRLNLPLARSYEALEQPERLTPKGSDGATLTDQQLRRRVAQELVDTEENYVDSLAVLVCLFLVPMQQQNTIPRREQRYMFSEAEVLWKEHVKFLAKLKARLASPTFDTDGLADIFLDHTDFLLLYTTYINNYEKAIKTYFECMSHNAAFRKFIEEAERHPRCKCSDFQGFLIQPIQRIPRYSLLLRDLLKYNERQNGREFHVEQLKKALQKIQNISIFINETKRKFEYMLELQARFKGLKMNLMSRSSRKLIREGHIMLQRPNDRKQALFFLFTDVFIIAKLSKKDNLYNVLETHHLRNCWLSPVEDYSKDEIAMKEKEEEEEPQEDKNPFASSLEWRYEVELRLERKRIKFFLPKIKEHEEWLAALEKAIRELTKRPAFAEEDDEEAQQLEQVAVEVAASFGHNSTKKLKQVLLHSAQSLSVRSKSLSVGGSSERKIMIVDGNGEANRRLFARHSSVSEMGKVRADSLSKSPPPIPTAPKPPLRKRMILKALVPPAHYHKGEGSTGDSTIVTDNLPPEKKH